MHNHMGLRMQSDVVRAFSTSVGALANNASIFPRSTATLCESTCTALCAQIGETRVVVSALASSCQVLLYCTASLKTWWREGLMRVNCYGVCKAD